MRWTLLPLLLLATSLTWLNAAQDAPPREPVTVILVRHAETEGSTRSGGDPQLSETGSKRSRALARLLAHSGISHLFSSELARTKATLAELAKRTGLEVQPIPNKETAHQLELLKKLAPGSVAVVCGHSNTVPDMAKALGGKIRDLEIHSNFPDTIPHSSYDRLFVITLPGVQGAAPHLVEMRYGKLSSQQ